MAKSPRMTNGRLRRWLPVSAGLCAVAVLAACGTVPSNSGLVTGKTGSPTVGAAITMQPITATMPPSATPSKSSTPTSHSSKSATSSPTQSATSPQTASPVASGGGSSSAPVGPSGSWACTTSQAKYNCSPVSYPLDEGTASNPSVGNNVWAPIPGWQQTLYANNPGDWSVVANMPAGNTAVVSYPSNSAPYGKPLSSFKTMYSSFTETMNPNSQTSAWAAYDIWLNNGNNEVMIQHDFANNGACSGPSATFGGSNGVPVQHWYLCGPWGSEYAWKLKAPNEPSGTVDILAMLTWLENHGNYLPKDSVLEAIGYGWEIASTGGQPETFRVSRYSISVS